MNRYPCRVVLSVALALAAQATRAQSPPQNARCLSCHGNQTIMQKTVAERALMVRPLAGKAPRADASALYIAREVFDFSVHGQTACTGCHPDCDALPHAIRVEPARCGACHEREQSEYEGSVHGRAVSGGDEGAARCRDCHGSHDILSPRNPQSRTYKLQLPSTCAKCHANPRVMETGQVRQPHAAEQYIDSMHGRGLIKEGLIVAPSCNNCHGVHNIWPAADPRSTIYKDNVPKTCGKCHIGVEQIYRQSVHGKLLEAGDPRGPVCATCHTAHEIAAPNTIAFKLRSDERCGQCHADRLERYRETFHGKAMALGQSGVAACYDCHGHHDIVPISNPASRLAPQNKLQTCRQCHPQATAGFTKYIAHADHTNRQLYPGLYWVFVSMTTIVLGTFVFFGVHTGLWFVRSAVLYIRDPAAFRQEKAQALRDDEVFVRFRPFERFLHFLVVVSFLLLVATGMPLKFYYTGWAKWMVHWMGGLQVAGALHRIGAVITFLYFALHLGSLALSFVRHRRDFRDPKSGRFSLRQYLRVVFGPEMPLPNRDDIRDWWAHQMWFFGRGPRPQFDRWTYWEKFDYFAVFWGVAIIGLSGLVMWFPEQMTRVLPGWMINIALIIHSDEALLAAGFIFTFHFFNVHFRLEKFPMDPVIFSGRMSAAEMLHERRRWYDRLATTGQLEKLRLRDEWSQWKRVMHPVGFLAFGLGTVLLVLIFYAMASRLLGH
jgi:cytochrome b subunit of formate dehydrogenase/nitrate/TMAO reductase-like tetraheme cytochrome c subunit